MGAHVLWYWADGGRSAGPLELRSLQHMASLGTIRAETWVRRADAPSWTLARDVPELGAYLVRRDPTSQAARRWAFWCVGVLVVAGAAVAVTSLSGGTGRLRGAGVGPDGPAADDLPPSRWVAVEDPTAGFRASFPGEPREWREDDPNPGGAASRDVREWARPGAAFRIITLERPAGLVGDACAAEAVRITEALRPAPEAVSSMRVVRSDDDDCVVEAAFEVADPECTIRRFVRVVVRARLFVLVVDEADSATTEESARRFFESFEPF